MQSRSGTKQWCKSWWSFCPVSMACHVQTSQTVGNEQYSTACVLKACQTQCQGLPPQQTLDCHSHFCQRVESLTGHAIQLSHWTGFDMHCQVMWFNKCTQTLPCRIPFGPDQNVAPLTQSRKGRCRAGRGAGRLSAVAAQLCSRLHSACASNYRQRRGGPVLHVVPFRAGETM